MLVYNIMLSWFGNVFGFDETDYPNTTQELNAIYNKETNTINNFDIGNFHCMSIDDIRKLIADQSPNFVIGNTKCGHIVADVGALHKDIKYKNAMFQVASQLNLLEFAGPNSTPEMGITIYQNDRTQGPICAMNCAAATAYRNYLIPMKNGTIGQTADNQINCMEDMEKYLSILSNKKEPYWTVKNGYIDSTSEKLTDLNKFLKNMDSVQLARFRSLLKVGIHFNTSVTSISEKRLVSQIFCSAASVSYSRCSSELWEPLARIILEGAYEATLLSGVLNNIINGKNTPIVLTQLGGGAFGNKNEWIIDAIKRSLKIMEHYGLNVQICHYGQIDKDYECI